MLLHPTSLIHVELSAAIIRDPLVATADTSVAAAIALMSGIRTRCTVAPTDAGSRNDLALEARSSCVIVAADQRVMGILTERDVVRLMTEQRTFTDLPLAEVMTQPVVTLREAEFTDLFLAVNLQRHHRIRHLPVVDQSDRLVGLITHESLQQIARTIDLLRLRRVEDVMVRQVICADPTVPILDIARLMAQHRVSSVVIVQADQWETPTLTRPLGIITERDIVQFQTLGLDAATCPAGSVMSTPAFSIQAPDSLWQVQITMEQRHIRRLVVTGSQGELVGLVTQSNLLHALNPLELYKLAEGLEQRVVSLEAEKVALLESRNAELEAQLQIELAARQRSETLIQRLAETFPGSLYTMVQHPDGSIEFTYISPQSARMYELEAADILNNANRLLSQIHPDDRAGYQAAMARSAARLKPFYYEWRMVLPSGKIKWFQAHSQPERLPNHDIRWFGVALEVSDRKQAELALAQLNAELEERVAQRTAALQEREAHYRALMDRASDAILLTDLQGNLLEANRQAEVLLGYSRKELTTMHFAQLHPPEAFSEVMQAFHGLASQAFSQVLDINMLCKDGSIVPVDISASVLEINGETIVQGIFRDIRDRKAAALAMQQSEAKYRQIFEIANEGIWAIDQDARTMFCNQALTLMLGTTIEAMTGRSLFEFVGEEIHPSIRERLKRRREGVQEQYELSLRRSDGSSLIALVSASPLLDETGQFLGSLAMLTDISDRKQAEAALQTSETLFRRVFDSNVVGMIFTTDDGGITDANDCFLTMLGYSREDLQTGRLNWQALTPPEYAQQDQEAALQLQQFGAINPREKAYYHRDGYPVPVLLGLAVLSQEAGTNVGVVVDIRDRKQAEQIIQQQAQQETLLRQITQRIRQSLDLQVLFDTACQEVRQVLQADRVGIFRFLPNTGYDDGEFVAESVVAGYSSVLTLKVHDHCFGETYAPLYIQGRYSATTDVQQLEACHTNVLSQFQVKSNLIMPLICGQELWGLLCIHQCRGTRQWQQAEIDLSQQLANQLAIAIQQANLFEQLQQELTERQQTQHLLTERNQQLAQSNQELARATRLKDEFLANMSHELRTPLNAILGMTEGLQEEVFGPINDQQAKSLHTVETSATHLLSLINDILDVAKIESGQIELDCASVAVAPLCSSSLAFIKQQALKKSIRLATQVPAALPTLRIDERRIRQVLINLLTNAVKFTPEGGSITLSVTLPPITSQDHPPFLRIAIQDTGIGIAPENIGKLFQPFVQIDSALNRQYTGTGLGLALVKQIVELHGGEVGLTSELGVGSCFTIDLPCDPEALQTFQQLQPTLAHPTPTTDTTDRAQPTASPLILLAEDNEANISTIANYLKAKGYRMILAPNGLEAIELAQTQHPDLILMDIQMPNLDGLEAIRRIRSDHRLDHIPIIALTALAMAGDRERCLAAGANEYLSKPVRLKQLTTTIQQFLVPISSSKTS